jgi:hypothetical protein
MSSLLLYADICWKITSLANIFYDAFTRNAQPHMLLLTKHFLEPVSILPKSLGCLFLPCVVYFFVLIFLNPDGIQDIPLSV